MERIGVGLNMKLFLSLLLLSALPMFGANPAYTSFRGTGGILIVSNPPNGTIVIDGSAISGGVTAPGDTFNVPLNSNDIFVASSQFNFHPYFFYQEFVGPTLSVNNSAGSTNYLDPFGVGALGPGGFFLSTSNATLRWQATIDGSLVPVTANRYDVGSAANPVRSGYFSGFNQVNAGSANITNTLILANGGLVFQQYGGTVVGFSNTVAGALSLYQPDLSDNEWRFGGNVTFGPHNTYDIGASGANSPRNLYVAGEAFIGAARINQTGFIMSWPGSGFGSYEAGGSGRIYWNAGSRMYSTADGTIKFSNAAENNFTALQLGGITAAFPAIGRTNGDLVVFGANGLFAGGSTNRLMVHGGLAVGPTPATITNTLFGSLSLDFPSTVAGTSSDLPIAVTGVTSNNCHVSLCVPGQAAAGGGIFTHYVTNDTVVVRFSNNQLTLAIDPTPAVFSALVFRVQ